MSHECATPLNSIIGIYRNHLQGLAGPLNEGRANNWEWFRTQRAANLLALVNDVFGHFSKIEAGQFKVAV